MDKEGIYMRDDQISIEAEAMEMYSLLVRIYKDEPLENLMDEIEQLLIRIDNL